MTGKTLHNPKSHAPAIYLPCWLSQVPTKLLSLGAKLVYGRLSQWSNNKGLVHRTTNQIALELGMCKRSVGKYYKELKDADVK